MKKVDRPSLVRLMEEDKIYLNNCLRLNDVSALLNVPSAQVTLAVRKYFRCNLRTLLNYYRVRHAKMLLSKRAGNITQIAERSGFLSRSTFYLSFRTFEKGIPTEFIGLPGRQEDPVKGAIVKRND